MNQILYLDGVSVSFDGFKALSNLSFYIDEGELRAIIGPNGAGKTTLMDVVTGKTRPSQGKVEFKNKTDLTSLDEAQIANLGIGRKFQKPTIFENQTVFENLELATSDSRELIKTFFFKLSKIQIISLMNRCERLGNDNSDSRPPLTLGGGLPARTRTFPEP